MTNNNEHKTLAQEAQSFSKVCQNLIDALIEAFRVKEIVEWMTSLLHRLTK